MRYPEVVSAADQLGPKHPHYRFCPKNGSFSLEHFCSLGNKLSKLTPDWARHTVGFIL
jgi:hypothetical protein